MDKIKNFFQALTRPRSLGILVVTGVPAIVGGGLIFAATGDKYPLVVVYEIVLYATALFVASKASDLEH